MVNQAITRILGTIQRYNQERAFPRSLLRKDSKIKR